MPLTFDMPYEALSSYRGSSPRPPDFDAYWRLALEELDGTDPKAEIVPAAIRPPSGAGSGKGFAEYHDLWFTGVGGARVHAKLVKPVGEAASRRAGANRLAPAILQFHGYTADSGDWQSKLGWAAAGYLVAALDCRGQGGLSDDCGGATGCTDNGHIVRGLADAVEGRPEKLLFRAIFLDTVQLARVVMGMDGIDPARVGATGGSQGGGLTLACAALEPRIARAAPVFPFLCDYKRVWQMDMAKDAYAELKTWFRRFDPRHLLEEAVFDALGYIDVQNLAPRVRAEVLMGLGLMDTVCPPSTQFSAFNKIAGRKSLALYPDFGHEDLPGFQDDILEFMGGL